MSFKGRVILWAANALALVATLAIFLPGKYGAGLPNWMMIAGDLSEFAWAAIVFFIYTLILWSMSVRG